MGFGGSLTLPCIALLCIHPLRIHPVLHFIHTLGLHLASGCCGPPAQPSRTVPARCQVCLPVSLGLKFTSPEGNLISLAGQVPPVLPDTPGRGARPGEGRRGKSQGCPRSAPSEGLAGRGTKGQPLFEPPLWLFVMELGSHSAMSSWNPVSV